MSNPFVFPVNEPRLRSEDTFLIGPGRFIPRRVKRSLVEKYKSKPRAPSPYDNPLRRQQVRNDLVNDPEMKRTPPGSGGIQRRVLPDQLRVRNLDPGLETETDASDVTDMENETEERGAGAAVGQDPPANNGRGNGVGGPEAKSGDLPTLQKPLTPIVVDLGARYKNINPLNTQAGTRPVVTQPTTTQTPGRPPFNPAGFVPISAAGVQSTPQDYLRSQSAPRFTPLSRPTISPGGTVRAS